MVPYIGINAEYVVIIMWNIRLSSKQLACRLYAERSAWNRVIASIDSSASFWNEGKDRQ